MRYVRFQVAYSRSIQNHLGGVRLWKMSQLLCTFIIGSACTEEPMFFPQEIYSNTFQKSSFLLSVCMLPVLITVYLIQRKKGISSAPVFLGCPSRFSDTAKGCICQFPRADIIEVTKQVAEPIEFYYLQILEAGNPRTRYSLAFKWPLFPSLTPYVQVSFIRIQLC